MSPQASPIAFAGNDKAYVALSSENQIAVIDVARRTVVKRSGIPAQDPRAIVLRAGRLYVIPFESGNQTQLSGGTGKPDGNLATFNAWNHSIATNNVLSLGHVVDIVKHPKVPDRDLFVFDTATDTLVETVNIFTVDVASGKVLGRVTVGAVPQGIALECGADGQPSRAWVLNAAADTVSLVDVSHPSTPGVVDTILLADPTHPTFGTGAYFSVKTAHSLEKLLPPDPRSALQN